MRSVVVVVVVRVVVVKGDDPTVSFVVPDVHAAAKAAVAPAINSRLPNTVSSPTLRWSAQKAGASPPQVAWADIRPGFA